MLCHFFPDDHQLAYQEAFSTHWLIPKAKPLFECFSLYVLVGSTNRGKLIAISIAEHYGDRGAVQRLFTFSFRNTRYVCGYSVQHGVQEFEGALEMRGKQLLTACWAGVSPAVSDAGPAVGRGSASALCHRKLRFWSLLLTPLWWLQSTGGSSGWPQGILPVAAFLCVPALAHIAYGCIFCQTGNRGPWTQSSLSMLLHSGTYCLWTSYWVVSPSWWPSPSWPVPVTVPSIWRERVLCDSLTGTWLIYT